MTATAAQRRHWNNVVRLGCAVTGCGSPCEIAHAHGGSIVERMQEPKAKGKKLRRMNWLVLPLCPPHHRTGEGGVLALDLGVWAWELANGTQAEKIDRLCQIFKLDLWALARER